MLMYGFKFIELILDNVIIFFITHLGYLQIKIETLFIFHYQIWLRSTAQTRTQTRHAAPKQLTVNQNLK